MPDHILRLLVENLPERNFIQAIFLEEIASGAIALDTGLGAESTIAIAQSSLLNRPSVPVALVLNSGTKDRLDLEYKRSRAEHILASANADGWIVALAIPKIDAWVKADGTIQDALKAEVVGKSNYYDEAIKILEIIKTKKIDRQILRKKFLDFRKLDDFIKQHTVAKPARASL